MNFIAICEKCKEYYFKEKEKDFEELRSMLKRIYFYEETNNKSKVTEERAKIGNILKNIFPRKLTLPYAKNVKSNETIVLCDNCMSEMKIVEKSRWKNINIE